MAYKLGIDVGGTFTDFLLVDEEGKSFVYKALTTPKDPSEGVLSGFKMIGEDRGKGVAEFLHDVNTIVHGTTITTNAVLTREGAKAGFITTKGFRDPLILRRGVKKDQYNFHCSPEPNIIPRYLIQVAEERVSVEGKVVTPLVESDVERAIRKFKEEKVEAVGVAFLFSFYNPIHEARVGEILRKEMPNTFITLSTEVLPQIRLYERSSTVALNAYVGPALSRYLDRLDKHLEGLKYKGVFLIMQSNGGVMSPEIAKRFAMNTLLSGPAGGPAAGLFYASAYKTSDIITIDMGGTSFDACLVKGGVPLITMEGEVGGEWLATPKLDIHTIGAGGGSLAWINPGGLLEVGPKSAGADPGPVCYDRGGETPTVTDADFILGYLDPNYFFGGRLKLNLEKAKKALDEKIAKPLKLSVVEAAEGIYRVINSRMSTAVAVVSTRKGYDPREFTLIVAGGAGPIHAAPIAEEMDIPRVVVPRDSSVFCASGMLMCDLKHDFIRTYTHAVEGLDLRAVNDLYANMFEEGNRTLRNEGIPAEKIALTYSMDMRYIGQFSEVEVAFEMDGKGSIGPEKMKKIADTFHQRHDTLYGYSMPGAGLEIINLRVSARGITDKPKLKKFPYKGKDPSPALKGKRQAFFKGNFVDTPVYDVERLENGNMIEGPALLEQATTTTVVPPGWNIVCDEYGNFELKRS